MDIGALVEAQKNSAKDRKAQQSNHLVQQGFILLAKAEEEGFKNKFLLKRAAKIFLNNILQHHQNIEAHLGLSYVFLLLSNYSKAEYYLNQALSISPEHPDVHKLLQFTQSQAIDPDATAVSHELDEDEFDALYDKVEFAIYTHIRTIMAAPSPQITLNLTTIKSMEQQLEDLEQAHLSILNQLVILDKEFDINELKQKLKPIELTLKRYEKVIKVSSIFANIEDEIKHHFKIVCKLLKQLEGKKVTQKKLEQSVENLLDASEHFTEQLDYLDNKGYNIQILKDSHRELLDYIDRLQNTIEENS